MATNDANPSHQQASAQVPNPTLTATPRTIPSTASRIPSSACSTVSVKVAPETPPPGVIRGRPGVVSARPEASVRPSLGAAPAAPQPAEATLTGTLSRGMAMRALELSGHARDTPAPRRWSEPVCLQALLGAPARIRTWDPRIRSALRACGWCGCVRLRQDGRLASAGWFPQVRVRLLPRGCHLGRPLGASAPPRRWRDAGGGRSPSWS